MEHLKKWWMAHLTLLGIIVAIVSPSVQQVIVLYPKSTFVVLLAWSYVCKVTQSPLTVVKPSALSGLILMLCASLVFTPLYGCNAQSDAQKAENVIQGILNVASSDIAVVPTADQLAFKNYFALAQTLLNQTESCTNGLSSLSKSASFLACFNTFTAGLLSSSELAQLRLLSTTTQSRVQLYVTAIVTAVNVAVNYFGGSAVSTPAIAATPVTSGELNALRHNPILLQAIGQ